MNRALRAPYLLGWKGNPCPSPNPAAAASLFHSTPVLERRRNSRFRFNNHAMRFRSKEAKRTLLRDAELYLEHLLEGSWSSQNGYPRSRSSDYTSWFERQYFVKGNGSPNLFWDDTDDEESETTFGTYFFGGEELGRKLSRQRKQRVSWNWKNGANSEYSRSANRRTSYDRKNKSQNEGVSTDLVMTSHRLALGLTATGPLKLEEVKSAYRACALRWHPDRHQGSSKATAEEKFKYCTAAYKSIYDKLISA